MKFTRANDKLKKLERRIGKRIYKWDILAGHSCPYAKDCRSHVDLVTRKIVDGPHTEFRCYAASLEAYYPASFNLHQANMEIVKIAAIDVDKAADILYNLLPEDADVVRIHTSGDFQTLAYFDAWIKLARRVKYVKFYAYTKALPFWVKRMKEIPSNLILTASYGGYRDDLIEKHGLRYVKVVNYASEAKKLGLLLDKDDYRAYNPRTKNKPFALLVHGVQPAGSTAAVAVAAQRKKRKVA